MNRWLNCIRKLALTTIGVIAVTLGVSRIVSAREAPRAIAISSSVRCPWLNQSLSSAQRLRMLLPRLTLADKVALVHGVEPSHNYGGYVTGIPRLCVPALKLNDGPAGVGDGKINATA